MFELALLIIRIWQTKLIKLLIYKICTNSEKAMDFEAKKKGFTFLKQEGW